MSVTLSPIAPQYAVSDADDPFKKYWWAILMGIVFTAIWLLTPMLGERSVGSTVIDTTPKVAENVEQSFSADAGDGINLSMEGTGRARKEDPLFGSSLYQPAPEDAAATAAATAGSAALGSASGASGGTLAGALKKVSESDAGWGGKKAQRGFDAPKLAGRSLSGMGAASGGKAGAASGSSAFGSSNAKIGFAGTKGLSGDVDDLQVTAPNSKGAAALKAAASQAQLAASSRSSDDARSSLDKAFDGAKGGSKIGGGAGLGGGYAALDAAPVNLKLEDPKLNEKKIEPPLGVDTGADNGMEGSELAKQIAIQVAGAVLGAVIGGPVGGIVTQVAMQAIQRQEEQQAKVREMEEKQQLERAKSRMR